MANSKHACKFSKKVASSLVVVDEILDCRRESVASAIQWNFLELFARFDNLILLIVGLETKRDHCSDIFFAKLFSWKRCPLNEDLWNHARKFGKTFSRELWLFNEDFRDHSRKFGNLILLIIVNAIRVRASLLLTQKLRLKGLTLTKLLHEIYRQIVNA